jgi:hypothetical protein
MGTRARIDAIARALRGRGLLWDGCTVETLAETVLAGKPGPPGAERAALFLALHAVAIGLIGGDFAEQCEVRSLLDIPVGAGKDLVIGRMVEIAREAGFTDAELGLARLSLAELWEHEGGDP